MCLRPLGRGPLGQKVAKNVFVRYIGILFMSICKIYRYIATKKSSQAKNLPDTEKTGDL